MRKIILIGIVSIVCINSIYAQTYDEWFKQKKTQLKYLVQQIAALQVYEGYLHTGYDVAKDGLNTISNIKNGEFSLHQAFISSLSVVNQSILHDS